MTYKHIIEKIFKAYPMYHKIGAAAYKEGLENIETLLSIVGNPERKLTAIHIAGTNGKGSVAHLLASYCMEQGCKTGLFTSPHLIDFRERIKIDGRKIEEQQVIDFFKHFQKDFTRITPSFFEITTALAFYHFARQQTDVAIVETGLGGRLDATNVLTPLLSVITNISLEHAQQLGNTIAAIATEKAGIIKTGVPVVIGEYHPNSYPVFSATANHKNAPLFLAENEYSITGPLNDCTITNKQGKCLYEHVNMSAGGEYQRKNLKTFLRAVDVLEQLHPTDRNTVLPAIENLVKNTNLMGRWQILRQQPLTICDIGHNAGGLQETMRQLAELPYRKLHFVFGIMKDKDTHNILPLLPAKANYYICQAPVERSVPADELTRRCTSLQLHCTDCHTVIQAYATAQANASPDDLIFIGGSCYVVGDLLSKIPSLHT